MKNFLYALLILAVITAIILFVKWDAIMAWWNRPAEGSECQTEIGMPGTIVGGICVPPRSIPEPPSVEVPDLEVSNPQGAYMYYQNDLASGGQSYSQSNILAPLGTKFKLLNTWQTNVSTQPYAGYYETTYKQYGPTSGFFEIKDVKKI